MMSWVEDKPKKPPLEGPRHAWKKLSAARGLAAREVSGEFVCERCGTRKTILRPKSTIVGFGGSQATPITHYRKDAFSHWGKKRPPCVDGKQTTLFEKDAHVEDEPRAVAPTRPAPTHESTFVEPERPEPSRKRPPSSPAKVFTLHMENLPEGVDVALEIVDENDWFSSEYRWEVFVHCAPGAPPVPRMPRTEQFASVRGIDRVLEGTRAMLASHPSVWVVARRIDDGYTRAFCGDGFGGWILREKGDVGER